jgi:formylglycine-generating enzyme required for sulfatase activity
MVALLNCRFAISCFATLIAGVLALSAPGAQTAAPAQPYRETVQGTVVSFEMVPVAGGNVPIDGASAAVEPFLIGRTEVTWDLYDLFAVGIDTAQAAPAADATARPSRPYGAPDYGWGHEGYPAISIARDASEAFCKWLSAKTGKTYRLPTEAEWLRAAALAGGQGGATADRDALTWHRGNADGKTHRVASRKADNLGLFDLFGNAAEWVTAKDGARVTRGGSFRDTLEQTGPAARAVQNSSWNERDPQIPKSKWWLSDGPFVGFRLATSAK